MATKGRGELSFRVWLGAVAALALVVRVTYIMLWSRDATLGFDASTYYELAKGIASHGRYELLDPQAKSTALFPPGFPLFLALGRVLGFGTRTKMLLWTSGLGTVTVVLIGLVARRLANAKVALLAALIAAVYPNLWLADGALMTETLTAALVVMAAMLVMELCANPRTVVGGALGVVLLWLSLTRSDGLVVAVLYCVAVITVAKRTPAQLARTTVTAVAFAALITVVGVGIWQIRVHSEMQAFVPIAVNSWAVVAGANCESAYYGERVGTWELPCVKTVEAFEVHKLRGEIAQNRYARDQGIEYAREHLKRLPVVVAARIGRAFGAYDPWRELKVESRFEGRSLFWSRAGFIFYIALIPLAILGWILARRGGARGIFVLLIPVCSVLISVAFGYGNHSFRMPLEPCLVVLAAMGLHRFVSRRVGAKEVAI